MTVPSEHPRRLNAQAEQAGREARARGEEDGSPPEWACRAASLRASWLAGWYAAGPFEVPSSAAPPATANLDLSERWPAGKPLPEFYARPVVPCPACGLVKNAEGKRAALMTSGGTGAVVHPGRGGVVPPRPVGFRRTEGT